MNGHVQILYKMLGKLSNVITLENFVFFLKISLFMAVLRLHCYEGSSLVVVGGGFSPVAACRLLIAAEQRLQGAQASVVAARGLRRCCSQALEHMLWYMG